MNYRVILAFLILSILCAIGLLILWKVIMFTLFVACTVVLLCVAAFLLLRAFISRIRGDK